MRLERKIAGGLQGPQPMTETPAQVIAADVWCRSIADHYADTLTRRHIEELYKAAQLVLDQERALAEAERKLAVIREREEALCRQVFLDGHSEGWRGNQLRRDVQHVDAEKGWELYKNGALAKTRAALENTDGQ